jgi:hypothetical protein
MGFDDALKHVERLFGTVLEEKLVTQIDLRIAAKGKGRLRHTYCRSYATEYDRRVIKHRTE